MYILILTITIIVILILLIIFNNVPVLSLVLKIILIILIIGLLALLVYKILDYFNRIHKSEPVLLSGEINARGGMVFPAEKIPKAIIGTEYTYSFWIYPSGWDYRYGKPKHILSRGSDPRKTSENMIFNPGVWFYPETSNLLIRFDTYGKANNFIKESDTVLNYIHSSESESEGSEVNTIHKDITSDECKKLCHSNDDCSGFSINKLTKECHLKNDGDIERQVNKDFDSYTKSNSMNPYKLGSAYFNPNNDCDLLELPLQRWSHIGISLWNRTTDIYLNGKLVRSCILKNVPKIPQGDPLYICQDGGFDGKFSQLRYFNRALNADEMFKLFTKGPTRCSIWGNQNTQTNNKKKK
jgi:hypothetical protein